MLPWFSDPWLEPPADDELPPPGEPFELCPLRDWPDRWDPPAAASALGDPAGPPAVADEPEPPRAPLRSPLGSPLRSPNPPWPVSGPPSANWPGLLPLGPELPPRPD